MVKPYYDFISTVLLLAQLKSAFQFWEPTLEAVEEGCTAEY
jgi:hypothetical protein